MDELRCLGGGKVKPYRQLLIQACTELWDREEEPALLFSGGTDSLTILWALHDVGARPTCYVFSLEGTESADLIAARKVCTFQGVTLKEIIIPRDLPELKIQTCRLIMQFQTARKTAIQCLYPLPYLLNRVRERQVFTGLNADSWYGTSKSDAINCSKDPAEFDRRREKRWADPTIEGFVYWDALVTSWGKQLCCPYRNPEVVAWLRSKSWPELNRPKQKQVALDAFALEFSATDVYRTNGSLQCISGIREWHDELLHTDLNKRGRIRVADLYRDILQGQHQPRLIL